MKNEQRKKIFNVKKSFTIADQVVIMEGDQLEYITTENNDGKVDIYFEVIDGFWGEGLEINLTPKQVADYLAYTIH
jgi:hypothetical protein